MSTRRGFLKQALIVMAGAAVVTPALTRAVEHIQKYHPDVQAVLDRFGSGLLSNERKAISQFVLSQIECGNWGKMDSFYHFGFEDPQDAITDWVTGKKLDVDIDDKGYITERNET